MSGRNEPTNVYPNYEAPVVVVRDGKRVVETLRWGMPRPIFPPKPGEKPGPLGIVTNVRNTASRHWTLQKPAADKAIVLVPDKKKAPDDEHGRHDAGRCRAGGHAHAECQSAGRAPHPPAGANAGELGGDGPQSFRSRM